VQRPHGKDFMDHAFIVAGTPALRSIS
jgi:hypothetical protein